MCEKKHFIGVKGNDKSSKKIKILKKPRQIFKGHFSGKKPLSIARSVR